jgi:hypothetical protein
VSKERYFSEREFGARVADADEVSPAAWGGVLALVRSYLGNQRFAKAFPEQCPDPEKASEIIGTDEVALWQAARAWVPDLPERIWERDPPETPVVMDFIEFLFDNVADCRPGWRHDFFHHDHLKNFNIADGQRQLRADVNGLFKRNRLAFALDSGGQIMRLGPPVLRDLLDVATFDTGDDELDGLLRRAVELFRSAAAHDRRDALEKLWDAYERLKSLKDPGNKKSSIEQLIGSTGLHSEFQTRLDADMGLLTKIGNDFRIRHAEVNKLPIETSGQVDYLFGRMFAVIWLLLQNL